MNKCFNCGKKIERSTVWCPYCGTEIKPKYSLFGTLLLLILIEVFVMFACINYKRDKNEKKTSNQQYKITSNVRRSDSDVWYKIEKELKTDNSYEISGYVLNTEKDYINNLNIYFKCYDSNNNEIGIVSDKIEKLEKNKMWQFYIIYKGQASSCKFYEIIADN